MVKYISEKDKYILHIWVVELKMISNTFTLALINFTMVVFYNPSFFAFLKILLHFYIKSLILKTLFANKAVNCVLYYIQLLQRAKPKTLPVFFYTGIKELAQFLTIKVFVVFLMHKSNAKLC